MVPLAFLGLAFETFELQRNFGTFELQNVCALLGGFWDALKPSSTFESFRLIFGSKTLGAV
jgi:hypothetical protein